MAGEIATTASNTAKEGAEVSFRRARNEPVKRTSRRRPPHELQRASEGTLPAGASPLLSAKPQTGSHQQAACRSGRLQDSVWKGTNSAAALSPRTPQIPVFKTAD
ncbi:MAG: hypothetical protein L3J39_16710 [Verrucomicrobiales bacterium]|nr:hypothetical protein [Verrucomicrobiales bacterium]